MQQIKGFKNKHFVHWQVRHDVTIGSCVNINHNLLKTNWFEYLLFVQTEYNINKSQAIQL